MKKFLAAFLGLVLCVCAGLLTGCKDLLHPEGPTEYTVTFYAENGSSGYWNKVTVQHGDSVGDAVFSRPSRSGYTFGGWYTERNGGGTEFTATTAVTADRAVYAKWTIVLYTVTFNADGGSPATQTRTVDSGASVGSANMPTEPTRSGYSFGGWWTATNGGGTQFTYSTSVSANRTVYAKWTANTGTQYTVTFNADGGSPGTQTRTVNSGASVGSANMPTEPTRSGYSFGGWWTATNGGGTQFTYSTTVSANRTVYAKWTANTGTQYTVTFDADGGSPATQTRTVNSGASVGSANMPTEPTRSGYTFGGWYTERNGGGTEFTATTAVTADRAVYVKWTANTGTQYTVTFNADGGSPATQTRTVDSGASLGSANMPTEPTRSGYTFGGWWTATNGGGTQFTDSTAVRANRTVYAKWTANTGTQYTVTFDADGGSPATQTRTVNSGASFITYSSVSGGAWTLQDDGRRQSPAIGSSSVTKARVSFTTATADGAISIQLDVSSESGCDYAFISTLDNSSATSTSGYYTGSLISGEQSVTVTIPVLTAGDHFIDIGYRKDGSVNSGSDCAWFKVTSGGDAAMPTEPTRSGYTFGGWWTATGGGGTQFTVATAVTADSTVYAKWLPNASIQISLQPVRDDPPLSNTALFVNEQVQFSAGSGYSSYRWYWNGEVISGAASSTYTLPANSKQSGIYELSVVVTTDTGERLSARCRVTIKDH